MRNKAPSGYWWRPAGKSAAALMAAPSCRVSAVRYGWRLSAGAGGWWHRAASGVIRRLKTKHPGGGLNSPRSRQTGAALCSRHRLSCSMLIFNIRVYVFSSAPWCYVTCRFSHFGRGIKKWWFFFGVFYDSNDPISTHMNDKRMLNSKSGHQITPGGTKPEKWHITSSKVNDLWWPQLTSERLRCKCKPCVSHCNTYPCHCPYHQQKYRSSLVSGVETVRKANFAWHDLGTTTYSTYRNRPLYKKYHCIWGYSFIHMYYVTYVICYVIYPCPMPFCFYFCFSYLLSVCPSALLRHCSFTLLLLIYPSPSPSPLLSLPICPRQAEAMPAGACCVISLRAHSVRFRGRNHSRQCVERRHITLADGPDLAAED